MHLHELSLITAELPVSDNQSELKITASSKKTQIAVILVLGATVVWGSQYILIKQGLTEIPLFLFQGIRHLIAFLGFCPWWSRFKKMNKQVFVASLLNAIAFYFLIFFVSLGLEYTTNSSEGAFMASMYVAFTPFVGYFMLKTKIKVLKLAGVAVAVVGMAIMLFGNSGIGTLSFNGDVLILIGAFFNAIQIVLLEKYTNKIDTMLFVLTQMLMISGMMLGTSAILQENVVWTAIPLMTWVSWLYLGIVAGTITLLIQANAQKMIDETRAALLYSLEPVFSIFFGILLGAEKLTGMFILGAGLIMAGIVLSSINPKHPNALLDKSR